MKGDLNDTSYEGVNQPRQDVPDPLSKTILQSYFGHVLGLLDYILLLTSGNVNNASSGSSRSFDIRQSLLCDGDSLEYKDLLNLTVVGVDNDIRTANTASNISLAHPSVSLSDVGLVLMLTLCCLLKSL